MIKLSINVAKLDLTRKTGSKVHPNNEYLTLLLRKNNVPDDNGYEYSIVHAQTTEERKNKAKQIYVGKGKAVDSVIADEDESKFFMVWVDGEGAPTVKHAGLKKAVHEAHRLSGLLNKETYVLELAMVIPAGEGNLQPKKKNDISEPAQSVVVAEIETPAIVQEKKKRERKPIVRKPANAS